MINSNVSSIIAHQSYMDNTAKNVANINTSRYVPTDTTIENSGNDSVKANSNKASDNGSELSQTNITKEIVNELVIENTMKANVFSIQTQDRMLGTLLDIRV